MAAIKANSPTSDKKENEAMENDTPMEINSTKAMMKKNTLTLEPVAPFSFGEGLPYAPQGWPNPGDIWSWKVGRRINNSGYYNDRYLYLPRSLALNPSSKRRDFQSKPEVERYIRSHFPDMDIQAFFAGFSWQVPSTELSPSQAVKSPATGEGAADETAIQGKKKGKWKAHGRAMSTRSTPRTRRSLRLGSGGQCFPSSHVQDANEVIDLSSLNQEDDWDFESELEEPKSGSGMKVGAEQSPNLTIAENFDDYLSTLEEIIVLPRAEIVPLSDPVVPAANLQDKMMECRSKLCSILGMDLSSLVSCDDVLSEVATLASQLRKDPNLTIDQLIKLKMVEELPLLSEAFKEAKDKIEEADRLLAELEAKKLKVPSLKKEYGELKEKVSQIEAEVDRVSSGIKEIDDQMLQLQSKRREMRSSLECVKKRKVELSAAQAMVANSIPGIVGEIQSANSEKPKWEMKKAKYVERVAEIQERFITLKAYLSF